MNSIQMDFIKAREDGMLTPRQLAKMVRSGKEGIQSYQSDHSTSTDLDRVPEISSDLVREEFEYDADAHVA